MDGLGVVAYSWPKGGCLGEGPLMDTVCKRYWVTGKREESKASRGRVGDGHIFRGI
jgi:hypothetical protein